MPIVVTCQCGQKLSAPDSLAGKKARCPKCGAVLAVPAPSANRAGAATSRPAKPGGSQGSTAARSGGTTGSDEKLFDEIGLKAPQAGKECPECHGHLPANAVLCVHCGYDFQEGKRLRTLGLGSDNEDVELSVDLEPSKSEVEKILAFAERELENEPLRQDMGYGTTTSAWLIFAFMVIVFALVVGAGVAFFNYMEGDAAKKDKDKSGWVTPQIAQRTA
ncbi:MAG: hypothetical protein KatS3mg110_2400 [Pirellulaceae bacterium]|nr:MAG: hypothetical protein KatS3mg110_2400 [Pirellulaceae bacterium]